MRARANARGISISTHLEMCNDCIKIELVVPQKVQATPYQKTMQLLFESISGNTKEQRTLMNN
ncbi:hypothetical protein SADUNF_Sadunf08G0148800 [Salix dunnii]|uniref:Uncharacterized protein n=1 Tax=Salix dunnii TaxID=1413687 RepID=A0A835JXZ6_9ROSI|nr:hypothetical protein SADUNF_Sadunf08G0148800 [Salix dunnii]